MDRKIKKTGSVYGLIWKKEKGHAVPGRWHFHDMQELIPEPIVRGKIGIEVGSGCGYDTYIMAKGNPSVNIFSLELSEGIFVNNELTRGLKNVWLSRASALAIPSKGGVYDFAYSYGVLHHTTDPEQGVREISRVLKIRAPVFLYLYEDHSENWVKRWAIKIISLLRVITTSFPTKLSYAISFLASPFAAFLFGYPARILSIFATTRDFAQKIPFNFATHPFSLTGDLYDRFTAPIEKRYSRQEACDLLAKNGFSDIRIDRIKAKAGWVAWGYKNA